MTALNAKFLLRTRYLSSFLSPASFSSPVYRVQSETNVVRSVRTFTRVYVSFDFPPITREIGSSSCLSICAQSCSVGLSIYLRSFISPTFTCIVRVPAPQTAFDDTVVRRIRYSGFHTENDVFEWSSSSLRSFR